MPTKVTLKDDGLSTVDSIRGDRRKRAMRSSILRNVNKKEVSNPDLAQLSSTDIRTSPRMIGYIYILLASSVMVASVAQFYINDRDTVQVLEDEGENTTLFVEDIDEPIFVDNAVRDWQLTGSLIVSCVGCFISLFVVLAHFDTLLCPSLWRKFFKDGSLGEAIFICAYSIFWAGGLYVNTSTFSVGSGDPNVYFTSWICFVSCAMNYDVWRSGAGKPTCQEWLVSKRRSTIPNWILSTLFLLVFSLAASDAYYHRGDIVIFFEGEIVEADARDWVVILALSWCFTALSFFCVYAAMNFHWSVPIFPRCFGSKLQLKWCHIEGVLLIVVVCVTGWAATNYTGVNAPVDRIGNVYFGAWGALITSLITLATWLKENQPVLPTQSDEEDEAED